MFFHEICEILMNTYSFKLYLVDLTVFPDLNLRLAKIKPFTTVSISKFSRFYCHTSSFLCYQVRKLRNFVFFKRFQLTSTVTCFSGLSLISIILWEYWENTIKTFWYYYKNKRIISWKIIIFFFFEIIQSVPTNQIIFIIIRICERIS